MPRFWESRVQVMFVTVGPEWSWRVKRSSRWRVVAHFTPPSVTHPKPRLLPDSIQKRHFTIQPPFTHFLCHFQWALLFTLRGRYTSMTLIYRQYSYTIPHIEPQMLRQNYSLPRPLTKDLMLDKTKSWRIFGTFIRVTRVITSNNKSAQTVREERISPRRASFFEQFLPFGPARLYASTSLYCCAYKRASFHWSYSLKS